MAARSREGGAISGEVGTGSCEGHGGGGGASAAPLARHCDDSDEHDSMKDAASGWGGQPFAANKHTSIEHSTAAALFALPATLACPAPAPAPVPAPLPTFAAHPKACSPVPSRHARPYLLCALAGGFLGSLQPVAGGQQVQLSLQWQEPFGGSCTDTFSMPHRDELHVRTEMTTGAGSVGYTVRTLCVGGGGCMLQHVTAKSVAWGGCSLMAASMPRALHCSCAARRAALPFAP